MTVVARCYLAWQRLDGENGHAVGRQLLKTLYADHVGGIFPEILIAPRGKPYFADGNWHFSVSHSQNHAFCVLSDRPVGVDGEELCRRVNPALAEKILSPTEKQQYDLAVDKNRALLSFWVLKEAAGKQTGQGIGFHPNYTAFLLTDARLRQIDGCLVAIISEEREKENEYAL